MVRSFAEFAAGCRRWTARLFVFCAIALLPQVAGATCGDYLAQPEHNLRDAAPHRDAAPMSPPKFPCRGPSCQRSTPPLPMPAPVSAPQTTDQWACADGTSVEAPRSSLPHGLTPDAPLPMGDPLGIERPPRSIRW
jgi:hypothetical protein